MLNLNSVMVGLQYLFLEPNADDPLNKGPYCSMNLLFPFANVCLLLAEAAEDLRRNRDAFISNVRNSMRGGIMKGIEYDDVQVPR